MSALNKESNLRRSPAQGLEPTCCWTVAKVVLVSFQLLLIASCNIIVRLGSVSDPCQ